MNSKLLTLGSLSNLGKYFQIIGVLGVVASLLFVGLELRQSQKIATAATQQDRNNSIITNIQTFTLVGHDWHSIALDNNLRYEFSEKEIVARNQYHIAWFIYENDFFHYSQGLMTETVWQAKLKAFEHWYNICDMRDLYQRRSVWMPVAFRELIESFPDKC